MAGAMLPGKQPAFVLEGPQRRYLLGGDGRDLATSGYQFWLQIPPAWSDHLERGHFFPGSPVSVLI